MVKFFTLLNQAFSLCFGKTALFFTAEITVWSIIIEFLPNSNVKLFVLIAFGILFVLWTAINLTLSFITLQKNPICISKDKDYNFFISKGDYIDNMRIIINDRNSENPRYKTADNEKTAFAMGIDMSLRLENSTEQGILFHVIKFLNENFEITVSTLQERIEAVIKELEIDRKRINYGDCIMIDLPEAGENFKLLFIVNSRHKTSAVSKANLNDVEGEDSRKIIVDLFNYINKNKISNVMLGAFGTNGLGFPYQIILNEIINAYSYASTKNMRPYNVILSIRNSDIQHQHLKMSEVIADIHKRI